MEDVSEVNSQIILSEIKKALESMTYGSIEIFVQDGTVTQFTVRTIHKTKLTLAKKVVVTDDAGKLTFKKD